MAKTLYYDSGGLLEATINDGTYSGTSWSDSNSMTNEERLVDQSISSAVTDFNNADALSNKYFWFCNRYYIRFFCWLEC